MNREAIETAVYRAAICDDAVLIRDYFKELMRKAAEEEGIKLCVTGYDSGEAVLEAWDEGDGYDLYLIDIHLSGMSGIQTLRSLRKQGVRQPVILMSASKATKRIEGATGYLEKGNADSRTFRQLLRSSISKEKAAGGGTKDRVRKHIYPTDSGSIDLEKVERIKEGRVYIRDESYGIELKEEELSGLKTALAGYLLNRR